jgi:flagellar motor switch protein FliN/FliY
MSDATSNIRRADLQAWVDAWKSCTQNVLSQVSGQANAFEVVAEPLPAADTDLRYTVQATGAVQGEMALRLPELSGIRLARKFLGEPEAPPLPEGAAPEPITNDDREALEELLRQIGGLAATAIGSVVGGQVQLQLSRADAPWAWTADAVASLRTRDEAGTEITIEIGISPTLAAALAARTTEAGAATEAAATSAAAAATPPAVNSVPDVPPAAGYRRLLDVGLGVKLRFGTRHMLLRDVLALSSGLVVELDNPLNSPVDLLLDGRIIARGEVVIIDGKYGLRVMDVAEPAPPEGAVV